VYINPLYDYKKSQQIYNTKYSYPGFIENGNLRNTLSSETNLKVGNFKINLMSSLAHPKIINKIKLKYKSVGRKQHNDIDPKLKQEKLLENIRTSRAEAVTARRHITVMKSHIDLWLKHMAK